MVNALAIISICICILAITVAVWFFIETKQLPWPKKKPKKKTPDHHGYY